MRHRCNSPLPRVGSTYAFAKPRKFHKHRTLAPACPRNTRRALCAIFTTAAGLCVRAFLRTLANVPTQCRKVHADRGNSCIVRAVNDKRAVNDSSAIQGRRHLLSPRTNLRAAGRVGNRASKDAHGRQHGICSHQGCDSSRHAWSQLSFEHTAQPTFRLIETTNGRWRLPGVLGLRGGARGLHVRVSSDGLNPMDPSVAALPARASLQFVQSCLRSRRRFARVDPSCDSGT